MGIHISAPGNALSTHNAVQEFFWMPKGFNVGSSAYKYCRCIDCQLNTNHGLNEEDVASKFNAEISENLQKKIMPWTQMFLDESLEKQDDMVYGEDERPVKRGIHNQLIVVASLIDKTPNLGGLCRSCEIFGVGTYIIGNKKYCEDKEFQNLSMTSHR